MKQQTAIVVPVSLNSTALAVPECVLVTNSDESCVIPASLADEPLAEIVIAGCKKFRTLIPYIIELRGRFSRQIRGNADIAGCKTWTEFCEKHLDRTTSAVQRAIAVYTKPAHSKPDLPPPVPEPAENPEPNEFQPQPAPEPAENPEPKSSPAQASKSSIAPKPIPCVCPKCEKSFDSRSQLKKHGIQDHGISPKDVAAFLNGHEPVKHQENPFDLTALFFGLDVHVLPVSIERLGDAGKFHVSIRNRTAKQVEALANLLIANKALIGIGTPMPGADKND